MLLFWKLVLIIKMSTSQDFKTTFKYNLTYIFLSLRAQLKKPLCPRTPCTLVNLFSVFPVANTFFFSKWLIFWFINFQLKKLLSKKITALFQLKNWSAPALLDSAWLSSGNLGLNSSLINTDCTLLHLQLM